ncbi:hypothetical protein UKS_09330 [Streptococcus sp. 116-D4]|nr:hypothetical protein UKS_09330 [Streptococcus sp. 116-D4]
MESQMNMETIRINIKYIMLGMITAGTVDMITADTVGIITADTVGMIIAGTVDMIIAGRVGMPTIITEALRNFS